MRKLLLSIVRVMTIAPVLQPWRMQRHQARRQLDHAAMRPPRAQHQSQLQQMRPPLPRIS